MSAARDSEGGEFGGGDLAPWSLCRDVQCSMFLFLLVHFMLLFSIHQLRLSLLFYLCKNINNKNDQYSHCVAIIINCLFVYPLLLLSLSWLVPLLSLLFLVISPKFLLVDFLLVVSLFNFPS